MFKARPTSLIAALVFKVPKVPIWATLASPYFLRTYSITSYRRAWHRSISMSGASERLGSRNRSKSRSYLSGQTLLRWSR